MTINVKARRLPSYPNVIVFLTLGFSIVALLLSYSAQYIWEIEPCRLCKFQRIPYFLILGFSGSAFWPYLRKVSFRLIQVSFLVSFLLACYHLLVLAGIVSDPCSVPTGIANLEDFQKMLNAPPPCSKAGWKFLGLPVAGYNALLASLFMILLRKNKIHKSIHQIGIYFA